MTLSQSITPLCAVAPHAGAWIEIIVENVGLMGVPVAPHAGAWIEMDIKKKLIAENPGRPSRRGVD